MSVAEASTPHGCTNLKLRQLVRRVGQHYDAELARAGLKTTQYSLLSQVAARGPIRPVELAAVMTLTASTLSRNLQPLLAAGWLVTVAGPDARSHQIAITTAGREKRVEAQRRWKAAQLALNATLGDARVAQLHGLIDEALALLDAG